MANNIFDATCDEKRSPEFACVVLLLDLFGFQVWIFLNPRSTQYF